MQGKRMAGIAMAILGSLLWGISGPASDYLFGLGVTVSWLISSKMLIAGVVTLAIALVTQRRAVLAPWRQAHSAGQMIAFIWFGMIAMQYIYFKAVAVAGAPTATILQYLSPVLVLVWLAFRARELPRRLDVVIIALAMVGTAMVVTKGHFTQLAITPQALLWGILAAVAAAVYTLLPASLLAVYSPLVVTGWAQLLGGLVMTVVHPFWVGVPHLPASGWAAYAFVVIFGTIIAYLVYLASLQYISPTAASLLDAFEPLGATVTSVVFLGFAVSGAELAGGALIIACVGLMALAGPQAPE
ncbi:DMT family transporter [Lacticaseibacillus nasuensis]|uniref:DMT family transporter n=1 Tax=Lacticaseibacillus nasuensis TaxID=944671 RepID=UPI002247DB72|nr:EamA family transporter [Lacticaseibacillus nasuensis]MCX2454914.1 DMT family transporter [Lacticaseibacillus nasuensis]